MKSLYRLHIKYNYVKAYIQFFDYLKFLKHSIKFDPTVRRLSVVFYRMMLWSQKFLSLSINIPTRRQTVLFFKKILQVKNLFHKQRKTSLYIPFSLSSIEICHGHSAESALFPWTIRFTRWLVWLVPWYERVPQTENKKYRHIQFYSKSLKEGCAVLKVFNLYNWYSNSYLLRLEICMVEPRNMKPTNNIGLM